RGRAAGSCRRRCEYFAARPWRSDAECGPADARRPGPKGPRHVIDPAEQDLIEPPSATRTAVRVFPITCFAQSGSILTTSLPDVPARDVLSCVGLDRISVCRSSERSEPERQRGTLPRWRLGSDAKPN